MKYFDGDGKEIDRLLFANENGFWIFDVGEDYAVFVKDLNEIMVRLVENAYLVSHSKHHDIKFPIKEFISPIVNAKANLYDLSDVFQIRVFHKLKKTKDGKYSGQLYYSNSTKVMDIVNDIKIEKEILDSKASLIAYNKSSGVAYVLHIFDGGLTIKSGIELIYGGNVANI